jgi:UV DNA damage endonuclease
MIRYGYACINMTLGEQGIRTGRTMVEKRYKQGGFKLASDISLQNAKDLLPILQWNEQHGIRLFRIGSELFPRWNHYRFDQLPGIDEIAKHLRAAGDYAKKHGHRVTTHPGQFHILGSPVESVVLNSLVSLERHSEMFDLMGFEPSYENKINIHVGAAYNDKQTTVARWLKNFDRLSDSCKRRLVIENDDKASMYSVSDLYQMLHTEIGIPITFDYFHHTFNTGDLSEEQAFFMARETWEKHGVTQCTHYSESRRREFQGLIEGICKKNNITPEELPTWPTLKGLYDEYTKIKSQAHSDYIISLPNTYNVGNLDIMVEAKAKEMSLLNYQQKNQLILTD